MPVDTKARYYQWFMTDDPSNRIVVFEWWPQTEITSSMALGTLYFNKREQPSDTWGPMEVVGKDILWVVAQGLARHEGFNVEVAVH